MPGMSTTEPDTAGRAIISVSELNRSVGDALRRGFPLLWVEGELSNVARPASGHIYFSLKDDNAQVRCAMFRQRNRNLAFVPENGQQVVVRAKVGLYEPRGEYQLIVDHMEAAGDGALRRAFELLKRKLEAEGLFAEERKRPLPPYPRKLAVVTSGTGAALRDIMSTLERRYPLVEADLYPVAVQGNAAVPEICRAFQRLAQRGGYDAVILARGGGSLEDLQAFNEEPVARAIADCPFPVISGVGHETDFSIADFVADRRAPTPTGAAEMAVPDGEALANLFRQRSTALGRAMQSILERRGETARALQRHLKAYHPSVQLEQRAQRLDELGLRLRRRIQGLLHDAGQRLHGDARTLRAHHPASRLREQRQHVAQLQNRLALAVQTRIQSGRGEWQTLSRTLDAMSPLGILDRGYAIITNAAGEAVRKPADAPAGSRIRARLAEGQIEADVVKKEKGEEE